MSNLETSQETLSTESGYLDFDKLSYVMKISQRSLFLSPTREVYLCW